MAARAGGRRNSGPIWDASPGGSGATSSRQRARVPTRSWQARPIESVRVRPSSSISTPLATTTTWYSGSTFKSPKGDAVNRIALLASLLLAVPALADESHVALKDSPGKQLVEGNCVMCHSLDYISMNSVFLDRKGWEASVTKMIKVMGAPISEQDAAAIIDYLARDYGK